MIVRVCVLAGAGETERGKRKKKVDVCTSVLPHTCLIGGFGLLSINKAPSVLAGQPFEDA